MNFKRVLLGIGIVLACAAIGPLAVSSNASPETREFDIKARQYAYSPGRIEVNRGDTVRIRLASLDVVHGFFLEGHDIDALIEPGTAVGKKYTTFKFRRPSKGKEYEVVEEIVFKADRAGKFRFRCSHTCGTMHPFMQGEFIVGPNRPYLAGMGAAAGLVIAMFVVLLLPDRGSSTPRRTETTEPVAEASGGGDTRGN